MGSGLPMIRVPTKWVRDIYPLSNSRICIGVIADDLTGSNDVGIQFFNAGFPTVTFLERMGTVPFFFEKEGQSPFFSFVAVVDSESRFNSSSVAYKKVRSIAKFFKENRIKRIYKKLDSTLRGNIGPEIDALIDEFDVSFVPVIPAFPELGRTTLNGMHYVDGILLEKSEYASDPKNPVKESFLPEVIKSKYKIVHINKNVISKGVNTVLSEIKIAIRSNVRIISFDAVSDRDMDIIANALKSERVVCGSAGMAGRLGKFWKREFVLSGGQYKPVDTCSRAHILGIIGSVKGTTRQQVDFLKRNKNTIIKDYVFNPGFTVNSRKKIVQDISGLLNKKDVFLYSASGKILVKYSARIADELGMITKNIIKNSKVNKLVLSGGDIAVNVCKHLGIRSMVILSEVLTGIPMVLGLAKGKRFRIVTKSGGFGNKNALKIVLSKLRKYILIIAVCVFTVSQVYSDVDESSKFFSTGIPQSSYEVPRNTETIKIDEIEICGARNVGEVLEKHGIFIREYGSFGSQSFASSRGFDKNDILILLDGRPVNDPKSGAIDLNEIPLEIVDRIEIINGPNSSLYGQGAISSTLNIITKDTPRADITDIHGSYARWNTQIYRVTTGSELEGFRYLLAGNISLSDGSRINSNYDGKNLSGKFKYKFSDNTQVKLLGIYYNSSRNLPGKTDFLTPEANDKKGKGYLDLEFDSQFSYSSGIKIKLYGNTEKYKSKESKISEEISDNISTLGINAIYRCQLASLNVFTAGINFYQNKLDSNKMGNPQETVKAVFAQNHTNLLDFLFVDISGRFDNSSLFGSQFNPSIGIKYPFLSNMSIIGNISRYFRTPTFEEISVRPGFDTEKGWNYEVGIENIFSSGNLKTGIFRYDIDDFIYPVRNDLSNGIYNKTNQLKASMQGVDISIEVVPVKGLKFGSIYRYVDPKNKDTGEILKDTEKHSVNLNLTHKTDFGLITYIYGKYVETYSDVLLSGSWSKFGLKLTQNLNRFMSVFFAADNVLDKQYEIITGYLMSAREISGGLNIKF